MAGWDREGRSPFLREQNNLGKNIEDSSTVLSDRVRLNMIFFRKRHGLRQEGFAARLGWGKHIIVRLENGYTPWSVDKIYKVSEVYGIPPAYFFLPINGYKEEATIINILRAIEFC